MCCLYKMKLVKNVLYPRAYSVDIRKISNDRYRIQFGINQYLKSYISPLNKELLRRIKCFKFLIWNWINLLFWYLCVKSKLQELWGHKAAPVMSHNLDLSLHQFLKIVLNKQLFSNHNVVPWNYVFRVEKFTELKMQIATY